MKRLKVTILSVILMGTAAQITRAALFDHSRYDAILHRYVDEEGRVDYDAVRLNSLSALESYFEQMGDADLAGWSIAERLAFWINAYNARTVYLIAQKPDMKKISQDFELFNRPFKIAGVVLTLNDIKHRILRGTVNPDNKKGPIAGLTLEKQDPRVPFALAGGTAEGPLLRNFAYTDDNVDETLESDTKKFINNPKHLWIEDGHLKMSSVFKWYRRDFEPAGGTAAFVSSALKSERRDDADEVKQLLKNDFNNARYTFDWSINAQKK